MDRFPERNRREEAEHTNPTLPYDCWKCGNTCEEKGMTDPRTAPRLVLLGIVLFTIAASIWGRA